MSTFHVHQKITAFVNQYRIYDDSNGAPGALLGFAHQKRLAFKERFYFYTDELKQQIAFQLQARKVIDLGGVYDVLDTEGYSVGVIRKDFKKSLLRSTWYLCPPGQETAPVIMAHERSKGIAIFRRVWNFIPYISDLPFFARYHFDFLEVATGATIGGYRKTTWLRDRYELTYDDRYQHLVDWRAIIALAVLMDALQGR